VRGVKEFREQGEVRAAPALSNQLVGIHRDEVVQGVPRQRAVGDDTRRVAVVADLPGLGHDAIGHARLAEPLGDKTRAKRVGTDVGGELERIPIHAVASFLRPNCPGAGTPSTRRARSVDDSTVSADGTKVRVACQQKTPKSPLASAMGRNRAAPQGRAVAAGLRCQRTRAAHP